MKIAILTASFLPNVGGHQVFTYNVARQFAASGNTVCAYVPAEDYQALAHQFRSHLCPLPRRFFGLANRVPVLGLLWAQRYLRRRQREENYDVWLVIVTSPSGYVASCLGDQVPIVLRASGADIQKAPQLGYGLRIDSAQEAEIARTVKSYDKLVALTETVRSDFLELGVTDGDIVTIPNGVDLEWFAPDRSVEEIRSELGWAGNGKVILTTGRNHPKKGFDLIPAVAAKLRDEGFQFTWYVVGLGVETISGDIRARGLEEYVITHDEVGVDTSHGEEWRFPDKKLVTMYQAADIYAFPSLLETFGMVQIEAMAAGTAVVSTDAPGCRDVIKHEVNGLQAKAGDVDSFAYQLSRLLDDPTLRAYLSGNGIGFVQAYGWPNVAKQYEDVFEALTRANTRVSQ